MPAPTDIPLTRLEALLLTISANKRNELSLNMAIELIKRIENPKGIVYTDKQIEAQAKSFILLAKYFCNEIDTL